MLCTSLLSLSSWPDQTAQASDKTYVYAAASLTGALGKLIQAFERKTGNSLTPVYGASSTLARQILHGAPAGLFISANALWMDRIEERDLIEPASRVDIAANQLVLIAPASDAVQHNPDLESVIQEHLGDRRLALADPAHVPAGLYAKQALETLGLWQSLKPRLARAANVRVALAYVERGETPLGIVYASDIKGKTTVSRLATFPQGSHPPIRYPLAILRGRASETSAQFRQFLQSSEGRAILTEFGFTPL